MNEKIKELKNQAMLFAQEKCEGLSRDTDGVLRSDIMTEKFAELIVEQCFRVALIEGKGYLDPIKLRNAMKQHFGVEE